MFRRDGDVWMLVYGDQTTRIRDAKGLHDIHRLLARPGLEMAALDLVIQPGETLRAADEGFREPGHAGEILDEEARRRYKTRLAELEDEIEEASSLGDMVRGEHARAEKDAIAAELGAAYGLGGRPRRAGDPSERARTTVTRRIKDAIARIEDVHPLLGKHLRNSVRTGTYCSYAPERPVDWEL